MRNTAKPGNLAQNGNYANVYAFSCPDMCSMGASISEFFDCSLGVKQGCLFSLSSYLRLLILSEKMVNMTFNCSQDLKKFSYRNSQTILC